MKKSILNSNLVEEFRKREKLQPYRIRQINHQIFKNSEINFEDMSNISKELRQKLSDEFEVIPFDIQEIKDGDDTTKIAFKTKDGHIIESVIIYHRNRQKEKDKINRITLCVSSQIGCTVGCSFCVTGKLGFTRNLEYQEIIGQVLYANNFIKNKLGRKHDNTLYKVRNVVFMGMGEPLLNYENVKNSIDTLIDDNYLNLSRRHVTISTVGIISGIQNLIKDGQEAKLALSLHAPNQNLREELIPIAKKHKLSQLMATIDEYVEKTDNRIFYEYIMIEGITDKPELAEELAELLQNRFSHVNLIPFNENPAIDYKESSMNRVYQFKDILEKRGITVTVRDSLGRGVKSSCGQLGYEKIQNSGNGE